MPVTKSSTKKAPCHTAPKSVVQPNKDKLLKRINRIEGQVRGIGKMLDADRYCVDILTQISAIQSALDATALQILEDHTRGCVSGAIQSGKGDKAIAELMVVMKKFAR